MLSPLAAFCSNVLCIQPDGRKMSVLCSSQIIIPCIISFWNSFFLLDLRRLSQLSLHVLWRCFKVSSKQVLTFGSMQTIILESRLPSVKVTCYVLLSGDASSIYLFVLDKKKKAMVKWQIWQQLELLPAGRFIEKLKRLSVTLSIIIYEVCCFLYQGCVASYIAQFSCQVLLLLNQNK